MTNSVISDLGPGEWNIERLRVGATVRRSWDFETSKGVKVPIDGADEFTTTVKDSAGDVVATLTLGDGHSVTSPNTLNTNFGAPISDAADTYTFETWWLRPDTDEYRPIWAGTIIVEDGD